MSSISLEVVKADSLIATAAQGGKCCGSQCSRAHVSVTEEVSTAENPFNFSIVHLIG